ncbi:hypothetical protein AC1031_020894 [Aphanomyces cochlioides]|nr:hypothetical protein AC1031_020894 [Aphanomyces cochlioides]
MERCLEFPIGLLAVLKAGGSMMPLDATFPTNRLKFMLTDANASVVVTTEKYRVEVEALELTIPVVYVSLSELDGAPLPLQVTNPASRFDEAYVVYTSGSTGKPKGVPVLHCGIVNTVYFSSKEMFAEGQRIAQMFSIAFDGCQLDIWSALSNGATLVFRGDDVFETLTTVNSIVCTPTALSQFGSPTQYSNLKFVAVAGEQISSSLKDMWAPHVTFMNRYGPTECAVETHETRLDLNTAVAVGAPLPNVNCYVLDENMLPVPVGEVGEIFLGGVCVSPEYINLPDQTAERFLDDPFVPGGGRMFRTGDFGRLLENGHFEVHGRKDSQVKLKGYRIELEEIGEAMMRHPQVTAAAAIVKQNTHLVGYFTPSDVNVEELRALVESFVPIYMVPSAWVGLESMPQNVNGKIDRKALEDLDISVELESFVSKNELRLANIWAEVLGISVTGIGRQTSFFALGGDSLSMIKVVKKCRERGMDVSPLRLAREPTLWRAALALDEDTPSEWPAVSLPIAILEEVDDILSGLQVEKDYTVYPVSSLQAGMLIESMQSSSAYLIQEKLALDTSIDVDWLCQCIQDIAQQREIFRSTFVATKFGIFQVYLNGRCTFKVAQENVESIEEFLGADASRGFSVGEVFARCSIVMESSKKYLVITIHHSLYDGFTSSLLIGDLMDAHSRKILPSRPSFRTVIDYIEAQDLATSAAFWQSYLSDAEPTIIGMKFDSHQELGDTTIKKTFHPPMHVLADTAKLVGVTVAEFSKLAWAATLRKFTRSNDILFGQVVSNRNIPVRDTESILGALVTTIPFRVQFNDDEPLESFMISLQESQSSMLPFSYASLIDMKQWANSDVELYDTLFAYQNMPPVEVASGFEFESIQNNQAQNHQYTLEVILEPTGNALNCLAHFNPSRINLDYADIILDEFIHTMDILLESFTDLPSTSSRLLELSHSHNNRLQEASFGPITPLPYELLQHAFEERAAKKPHLLAVEYEGKSITYGELNDQATTLAHELVSLGVGVGSRVAVVMERCLEFPIGLLAVLKAGGSMMPLDATFPANRLTFMLGDANASVVVTTEQYRAQVEALTLDIPVVYVSSTELAASQKTMALISPATRNDEAYVVYTSGSTGRPKGVPVHHVGAVNLTLFPLEPEAFQEGKRVMQFLAIGFDWCQEEIWKTLNNGATLVLRSQNVFDTLPIVDVISCTPTALSSFGHPSKFPNLQHIEVGGEQISNSLKNVWSPFVKLTNGYGPTECASLTHGILLTPTNSVTIGRARPNVNSYILDANRRPVPVGVVGEIYLGGICVSPGYINLPEQTAERFLDDPFVSGGGRMFRTGDFGRLLPNGNFEVLGRKDSQVKLKGYRIELEEIGEAMMRHPQVTAAAAIVKDKTHLVGYFTPPTVNVDELRSVVSSYLPVYMVPAVWVPLESMPQNVNGKTDRLALEAMDVIVEVESLETEVEIQLATVWSKVLDVDVSEIGRNTSFFALGGDSLSIIKVVAACRQVGLSITVAQLFKEPILRQAAAICGRETAMEWPAVVMSDSVLEEVAEDWSSILSLNEYMVYPVTPLQAGMLYSTTTDRTAYVMQHTFDLDEALTFEMVSNGFLRLAEQHEILRTTFVSLQSGLVQIIRRDTVGHVVRHETVSRLEDFLKVDRARGFELGDLFFVRLTTVSDDVGRYAVLTIHHTLYDGWSFPLLESDLLEAFHGRPVSPRPSFRSLVDYVQAQDEEHIRVFWQTTLTNVTPSLIAPVNGKTTVCEDQIPSLHFEVPVSGLSHAAKNAGVTLATLTKFAWAVTLRKFLRQSDIVIGQVMSNRNIPVKGIERMLGATLSTVPFRVQLIDSENVLSSLQTMQTNQGSILAHSHASLVDIKKWSGVGQELFDSLFVFQQTNESDVNPPSKPTSVVTGGMQASTHYAFELELFVQSTILHVDAMFDFASLSNSGTLDFGRI